MSRLHFRQRLIGALLCLSLLMLLAGVVPARIPLTAALGPIARMFDSVAPHFLIGAVIVALAAALVGAWRAALALVLAAAVAFGAFAIQHGARSLPLAADQPAVLRVLFFNVLGDNFANARNIAAAVRAADPDVVAFAESGALRDVLPELHDQWPHQLGCEKLCQVVVLSKRPIEAVDPDPVRGSWQSRLRSVELQVEGAAQPVTLMIAHKRKPWFTGEVEDEDAHLVQRVNGVAGPLVLMGDFNSAPWSRPMRRLIDETGLSALRLPVPTWPVDAQAFGVPIDNALVRGGARLVSLQPFGDDLGSNHRGLLAEIALQ